MLEQRQSPTSSRWSLKESPFHIFSTPPPLPQPGNNLNLSIFSPAAKAPWAQAGTDRKAGCACTNSLSSC